MRRGLFAGGLLAAGLAAALLPTGAARAEGPIPGFYAAGAAGFTLPQRDTIKGGAIDTSASMDAGLALSGALGYRFRSGIRLEGEAGYRHATVGKIGGADASGHDALLSGMGNLLYDIPIGAGRIMPYVGVGAGAADVSYDHASPVNRTDSIDDDATAFAYQGIAGLGFSVSDRLQLTVDYRYFRTLDARLHSAAGTAVDAAYQSHTVMFGFRWTFYSTAAAGEAAPAPAPSATPSPAPQAAPAPVAAPHSFLVFFAFDKAELTPDALKVIEQAAAAFRQAKATIIRVTGHTDSAGPEPYNFRLSLRRANVVKAELIRLGIPADELDVIGKGMTEPLVPTPLGVREPKNRRTEIAF